MARLPRHGAAFSPLYEQDGSLVDVNAALGLKPLSCKQERYLRCVVGFAIGQWWQTEGAYQKDQLRLTSDEVAVSLRSLAASLQDISVRLSGSDEGFQEEKGLAVTIKISAALSKDPETNTPDKAFEFLTDFRSRASKIAKAALFASAERPISRKGRIQKNWHDLFARAVVWLCKVNSIPFKSSSEPDLDKQGSRFLDVAVALERFLAPRMRAPSRGALVKRLRRSQKRRR
jgi:hypothetical protein